MLLQRFKQMSTTGGILQVKEEAQQRQQQQQQRRPGPFGVIGALPDADFLAEPELRTALLLLLIEQLLLKPHIKRAVINLKLLSQLASKVRQCRFVRLQGGVKCTRLKCAGCCLFGCHARQMQQQLYEWNLHLGETQM
jgi:hypothetical protein